MSTSKNALTSKTIIGLIVLLVCLYAQWNGTPVDAAALEADLITIAERATALVGSVLVIWGRFSAKKPLHILPKWLRL